MPPDNPMFNDQDGRDLAALKEAYKFFGLTLDRIDKSIGTLNDKLDAHKEESDNQRNQQEGALKAISVISGVVGSVCTAIGTWLVSFWHKN